MKTHNLAKLGGPAILGAALLLCGCTKNHSMSGTSAANNPPASSTAAANTGATAMTSPNNQSLDSTWQEIKGYAYDQRDQFKAKLNDMVDQISTEASSAKGQAATQLADARDNLRSSISQVDQATSDTWQSTKDQVGQAVQKAESAYRNAAE